MSRGPNSSLPQVTAGRVASRWAPASVPRELSIPVPPWQAIPAAWATAAIRRVTRYPPD